MTACPLWHFPARVTPSGTKDTHAFIPHLEEVGGEGRLRKSNGHFCPNHSTNLPLTATVARNSLSNADAPSSQGEYFCFWQLLFQQPQKHLGVWSVHARRAAPITLLVLLNEIPGSLIDFPASTEGFSMGPVKTSTKGSEWLGKNVFYASKSHWIKLRSSCGLIGV